MAKNEVAEVKNTAPAAVYDYGGDSHGGFEGTTMRDLSIPFINLLQTNSPEVEEGKIEGIAAGMLLNSVTGELLKMPVVLQPVFKEEVWVEWVPRTKGGGVVARHEPTSDIVSQVIERNGGSRIPPKDSEGKRPAFKMPNGSGNDLVETYYVYCLILDETGSSQEGFCVLAFSSTKIKVQKDWMTAMYMQKGAPPMWANRAKLSTVKDKNDAGQSYYNFYIAPFGETWRDSLINPGVPEGAKLLQDAKDFRDMILSGLARADTNSLKSDAEGEPSNRASDDKDEAPF